MKLSNKILIIAGSVVGVTAIVTGTCLGVLLPKKEEPKIDIYEKLNICLDKNYDSIEAEVVTKHNNDQLVSTYWIFNNESSVIVRYIVQKYELIDINNGTIPDSPIKTYSGEKTYNIIFNFSNLKINDDNFILKYSGPNFISGKIKTPDTYLNVENEFNDLNISFTYSNKIETIEYSYLCNDNFENKVTFIVK